MAETVVHVPERSRYEIRVDGAVAGFVRYRRAPGVVEFLHTEIEPVFEGRGLGSRLAAGALADVRGGADRVVATCPFVKAYLSRHPEAVAS
jgi:uncharacterized protein